VTLAGLDLSRLEPGRPVQTTLTLEAFLRLPEVKPYLEYEGSGLVRQKLAPTTTHALLHGHLVHLLLAGGAGVVLPELRTLLGGTSRVPDIAVYGRRPAEEHPSTPPRIAIEILSPGQDAGSEAPRCAWYVEQGTRLALLVDPDAREVRAFAWGEDEATLRGRDRVPLLGIAIPGPELAVSDIFAVLEQESS
jgi:Uma2 family endonuclease